MGKAHSVLTNSESSGHIGGKLLPAIIGCEISVEHIPSHICSYNVELRPYYDRRRCLSVNLHGITDGI